MARYICDQCNFITNDSGNYCRHKQTNKHIRKINNSDNNSLNSEDTYDITKDIYICNYCYLSFTKKSNLVRHTKTICGAIESNKDMIIKQMDEKIKQMKENEKDMIIKHMEEKIIRADEEKAKAEDMVEYFKRVHENATTGRSVSALTYLMTNFKKGNPLNEISQEEIIAVLTHEKRLEEWLIYHFEKKSLDRYVAGFIVDIIKKINPKDQQAWNSDVARLTYIVRELVGDETQWISDKNGIRFTKYVITPFLKHLRQKIDKYIINEAVDIFYLTIEQAKAQDTKMILANSVAIHLTTKEMKSDVLKEIAPHLSFELHKQNEKTDVKQIE